jgi:hypothetical protein
MQEARSEIACGHKRFQACEMYVIDKYISYNMFSE